jgi:hypothetical protein
MIFVRKLKSQLTESAGQDRYALFTKLSLYCKQGRYLGTEGEIGINFDKTLSENLLAQTKEAFQ